MALLCTYKIHITTCEGEARPIDGQPEVDVVIDGDPMEVVVAGWPLSLGAR